MSRRAKAASKQSDRNANKKAAKAAPEDDEGPAVDGKLLGVAKTLILESVAVKYGPKLQPLIQEAVKELKAGAKKVEEKLEGEKAKDESEDASEDKENKEETENKEEEASGENGKTESSSGDAQDFETLSSRLAWHNCLGLATPSSAEESKKAWLAMKGLEFDGGPRSKRRGNPIMDRLLGNLSNCLPQYLHVLLALIVLRSFLFRSYFACLPWLVFYQFASTVIPIDKIPQVPALPLDKIDVKFRVAITVGLNILVWFFFLLEIVLRIWWLEIILYTSIIIGHAYVVRPADK